jgi:hypothetical protein
MDRVRNAAVVIAALALASRAYAEHDHAAPMQVAEDSHYVATVGVLAAAYHSRYYDGDYQGAKFGLKWLRGRFEVAATGAMYQIDRNGRTYRGFGDLMVHGAVTLVQRDALAAGAHLMFMLPAGADLDGLGMGHVVAMPALWVTYSQPDAGTLGGSIGYARGLGGSDLHADHGRGGWPLVDPMSFSEITFDATGMLELARELRAGVRVLGAFPFDEQTRLIGAVRIAWRAGRVETTAEAQAGIAGDPVRMRGLVSTAMRF